MNRNDIFKTVNMGLTLMTPAIGLYAVESSAQKPNIIFILTDDQGYGDLGRHGHPFLETPNLDRLYDESVRFDNFYVSPSCSPSRAAIMTGMHEFENGVTHTLQPREHLFKDAITLPQLLKTVGYSTGIIGKWHLGDGKGYDPKDRGFDWYSTNQGGPHEHFDPVMIRNGVREKKQGFREDRFFDEAMAFIDENRGKPFFCYLATYSPHAPLNAPKDLIAKYRAKGLNEKHATYLAMVDNIDQNLGRMMQFLKERGLEENTIIMLMNDNGETEGLDVYNAGMRGCKCTIWEGGTRAMSLWKWPGRWQPHTVTSLTAHLDILPTLCDFGGVTVPDTLKPKLEGFDLRPLLESQKDKWQHNDRILFHHVGRWPSGLAASHKYAMAAVRQGNYLLVHSTPCDDPECLKYMSQCTTLLGVRKGLTATTYTTNAQFNWGASPADRWVLFDVKKDPACQNDMSAQMPELVSTLVAAYDKWWDTTYPVMIERGGDKGDPNAGEEHSKREHALSADTKRKAVDAPAEVAVPADSSKQESAMFKRMDVNGDQKVTKEEYLGLFIPNFSPKDADKDGVLNKGEFPYPAFERADADRDGKLTPAEFEALYSKQFDDRDKNKNGIITADEM